MTRTELQKMLAGELYLASDPDLVAARKFARPIHADERERVDAPGQASFDFDLRIHAIELDSVPGHRCA